VKEVPGVSPDAFVPEGPLPSHKLAVPARKRLGCHQERRPALPWDNAAHGRKDDLVRSPEQRALDASAEHAELVAKHRVLHLELRGG
jgi:hypothetical protein